jgi:hypothetical protein
MLLQCARDYPGLDPRTMAVHEIVFFYEGLRPELEKHTKPKTLMAPPGRRRPPK